MFNDGTQRFLCVKYTDRITSLNEAENKNLIAIRSKTHPHLYYRITRSKCL